MSPEEIKLAMEHSKPAGEVCGIPLRIVDKEFLDDQTVAIFGYPDEPENAVRLIQGDLSL